MVGPARGDTGLLVIHVLVPVLTKSSSDNCGQAVDTLKGSAWPPPCGCEPSRGDVLVRNGSPHPSRLQALTCLIQALLRIRASGGFPDDIFIPKSIFSAIIKQSLIRYFHSLELSVFFT